MDETLDLSRVGEASRLPGDHVPVSVLPHIDVDEPDAKVLDSLAQLYSYVGQARHHRGAAVDPHLNVLAVD